MEERREDTGRGTGRRAKAAEVKTASTRQVQGQGRIRELKETQ